MSALTFVGCSGGGKKTDENKELANRIELESTELIYSIESMDNVNISDLAEEAVSASAMYTISSFAVNTNNIPTIKSTTAEEKQNDNLAKTSTTVENNSTNSVANNKNESKKKLVELTTNDFGNADEYSKELVEKRAEVMLLCSKLRKGDIKLSQEELNRVNECIALVNSTAEYLEDNKGKIESEYQKAGTTASKVALREKLAIRQAKIQTGILAMDEIISIMNKDNSSNTKVTKQQATKNSTNKSNTTKNSSNSNNNSTTTKATKTNDSTSKNVSSTNATNKNNNIQSTTIQPIETTTENVSKKPTKYPAVSNVRKTNRIKDQNEASNNETNDAVSILVQPVKTNETSTKSTQSRKGSTANMQTAENEYIVRPRNVSSTKKALPTLSSFFMPQPLPKATIMPYQPSAAEIDYSV